ISFCEIGLKRLSSPEANLAIDDYLFSLGLCMVVRLDPFEHIQSGLHLARQLPILVSYFMSRIQLKHGPPLLLAFADVGRLSNLAFIASYEGIRSSIKCFLHIRDQLSLDPCASSLNSGEDHSDQTERRIPLLPHGRDIGECII